MKRIIMLAIAALSLFSCSNQEEKNTHSLQAQNEVIQTILTRRSIRKYTEQQISRALLDTVMKCAIYAPSGLNKQSWEIRVVQNPILLNKINERFLEYAKGKKLQGSAARANEPGFSVFHHAPTLIIVGKDKSNPYSQLDIGFMSQNVLLSSHALGWGSCPVGTLVPVLNKPENADLLAPLNLPGTHDIALTIALGYPDENPIVQKRYAEKVKIIE